MNPFQRLLQATRLTKAGDLQAATAAIQAALSSRHAGLDNDEAVIDVAARVLPELPELAPQAAPGTPQPASVVTPAQGDVPAPGSFVAGHFGTGLAGRAYKLYIPPGVQAPGRPLVVMLHGCTQDPDDFAAGTGMNALAQREGFFVLYPEQSRQANAQGCWNWFKHSHQWRGRGEPALIAAMTREVMARHAIDPQRVWVAGLSAGGAMAAILGEAYPELFAAVGVHSGLAAGVAKDLPSALSAMKQGGAPAQGAASGVPTIVFHGEADGTVHHGNGVQVVQASAGHQTVVDSASLRARGGRAYTRHVHRNAGGQVLAEHWLVHGAAHAWSGGSKAGSYTDPQGPDASEEMLRFFRAHGRRRL